MQSVLPYLVLAGVTVDTSVGIGTIINGAVIIVGFLASWYRLQAKTEEFEKQITEAIRRSDELTKQIQLVLLTVERLSVLSEMNEKRWERWEKS